MVAGSCVSNSNVCDINYYTCIFFYKITGKDQKISEQDKYFLL